jgi:hypothetical protein
LALRRQVEAPELDVANPLARRFVWASCAREEALTSWVRCICSACLRHGCDPRSAPKRRSRPGQRRRGRARFDAVCRWCARRERAPQFRRSRHTQPISGADRRCQDQPVRAERSEPRSGGLDYRRAVELAVGTNQEATTSVPVRASRPTRFGKRRPVNLDPWAGCRTPAPCCQRAQLGLRRGVTAGTATTYRKERIRWRV